MKIEDISKQIIILNPKYKKLGIKYISGVVREQLMIRDYKNVQGGKLNEDEELEPDEIPWEDDIPVEEPEVEPKTPENDEPEGDTELEPDEIPWEDDEIEKPEEPKIEPKTRNEISPREAKELLSYKGKIFKAIFTKKEDGSLRAINGMTGVRKYTSGGELPYSPKEKNVIPVYDLKIGMGPKGYRMINVDGLKTLNINGEQYEINPSLKENKILHENFEFEPLGDWVLEEFDYNDINKLISILSDNKGYGTIYRMLSIPEDKVIEDNGDISVDKINSYIINNNNGKYVSFSKLDSDYFKNFLDNNMVNVKISQKSEYYSLYDWFQDNFDDLDYDFIEDNNLAELENTYEVIAKLHNNFDIEEVF